MVSGHKDKIPLDSDRTPAWIRRKAKDIKETTLNFHFMDTLDLLDFCSPESLKNNYSHLVKYFVNAYDIKWDIAEAWVLRCVERNQDITDKFYEIDPFMFRVDVQKIAFPAVDPRQAYADYLAVNDPDRKYVDLRIGSTNTKEDAIWLIEHYWDDVQQALGVQKSSIQKRKERGALMRDSMIYVMATQRKNKPTAKEIQHDLDTFFPNDPDVDITTISKIRKKFEPENDWFKQPREVTKEHLKFHTVTTYDLKYKTTPTPHFTFE